MEKEPYKNGKLRMATARLCKVLRLPVFSVCLFCGKLYFMPLTRRLVCVFPVKFPFAVPKGETDHMDLTLKMPYCGRKCCRPAAYAAAEKEAAKRAPKIMTSYLAQVAAQMD